VGAANIVTAQVPLLGRVRCHRALIPALSSAMNELRQRNLTGLVDPRAFGGCWNPRLIRKDGGISRHAWGAAIDLNVSVNPTGLASAQDPRLVEVMQRWGFTSGARCPCPDPPPRPHRDLPSALRNLILRTLGRRIFKSNYRPLLAPISHP